MGSLFYYVGKAHKKSKNFRGKFDLTIPSKDDIIIKLSGETSQDRVKRKEDLNARQRRFTEPKALTKWKEFQRNLKKGLDKKPNSMI